MLNTREKILNLVDATTAPETMTQQEAFDFIEELIDNLEARRDALLADIANQENPK